MQKTTMKTKTTKEKSMCRRDRENKKIAGENHKTILEFWKAVINLKIEGNSKNTKNKQIK